jgi:hypothetical protein
MVKFEVFIPGVGEGAMDLTFRVEADNWLAALNTGLKKIGEKGGAGNNLLVDIQGDESIHVTDPKSGRVFRIAELAGPQATPEAADEPPMGTADRTVTGFVNPFDPQPGRPATRDLPSARTPARPSTDPATLPPQPAMTPRPAPRPPTARPKTSPAMRKPSAIAAQVTEVPPDQARAPAGRIGRERAPKPDNVDDVLAEIFHRVQELEQYRSPDEALDFVLDLAMEKISAESGSVFIADLSTNDLTLATARGPKSAELLRLNPRVPMGVGLVGFCAQEGLSLAISDAQRDPRFYRAISERIGYAVKTILAVPMMRGGRCFGCLEVLNKKTSSTFTEGEVAILAYLADATARFLETLS